MDGESPLDILKAIVESRSQENAEHLNLSIWSHILRSLKRVIRRASKLIISRPRAVGVIYDENAK